jgi:hypothetical protein
MRVVIILLFLFCAKAAFAGTYWSASDEYTVPDEPDGGETYYVDGTNGNDSWDGLAEIYVSGTTGPKATLNSLIDSDTDHRGRRILIRTGTYYESLTFTNGGSKVYGTQESEREIWAAYGDGEVVIEGRSLSQNLGEWSVYSGSVYQSTMSSNPDGTYLRWLVVDDNYESYQMVANIGSVDNDGEWFYNASTKVLYVYQPSGVTLSTANILVGEDDAYGGSVIRLYTSSTTTPRYLSFYNITLQGAPEYGFIADGGNDHIVLDHIVAQYNGKGGTHLRGGYSSMSKCHIQHNVMRNWPRGTWGGGSGSYGTGVYGGWPFGCGFSTGGNNSTLSGCYVHDNGGEGIGAYGSGDGIDSITFEDNISMNNWSMMMYADNATNFIGRRNFIYASPFDTVSYKLIDGMSDADTARGYARLMGTGFAFAEESYSPYSCDNENNSFYNNIIVGPKSGFEALVEQSNCGIRDSVFYNNTVILSDVTYSDISGGGVGNYPRCIRWGDEDSNDYNVDIANNIFKTVEDTQRLVDITDASETALDFDYNLWYHGGSTPALDAWFISGSGESFLTFTSTYSEIGGTNQNPLLDNNTYTNDRRLEIFTLTGLDINDYAPTQLTPNGTNLGSPYNTDFNGDNRNNWTVGAIEYSDPTIQSSGITFSGVTIGQ